MPRFLEDADIKVLMLGARRVGKTSIVASMTSDKFLTKAVAGTEIELTVPSAGQEEVIDVFKRVEKMMFDYFDPKVPIKNGDGEISDQDIDTRTSLSTFKLDGAPSVRDMDFNVYLKTKNRGSTYKIQFIDIPGEWIDTYRSSASVQDGNRRTLQSLVETADVLMIVSDSVLLMEDNGQNSRIANKIDNITSIIKDCVGSSNDKPEKLIMFTPAKCEVYFNRHMEMFKNTDPSRFHGDTDPMPVLMSQIQKHYSELINYLTTGANARLYDIAILPILTLGNIEFSHIDPLTPNKPGSRMHSDMIYGYYKGDAFANGDFSSIYSSDYMSVPEYAPQYCEQPLVMILLYQLSKLKKIRENRKWFTKIGRRFFEIFGNLARDEDLLNNIPNLRKNLAVNTDGYLTTILQDPISGVKGIVAQE